MSPNVSAMNMCLLIGADYFIIPTSPDFYCYQAIDSLTEVFAIWSEKIKNITNGKLVDTLQKINIVVDKEIFEKSENYDQPYNLANIQDFNSLMPVSQNHAKPIYEITKEGANNWSGVVWDIAEDNIKKANTIYTNLAESILKIIF